MESPILAPAAALVIWSLMVLSWVVLTRFPAFSRAGLDVGSAKPGVRYHEVESMLPESVNWKSHNFIHLMEQPTLFYATVFILALSGEGSGLNLGLAWGYVGLRVLHSLWQSLVNTLVVRIILFALSSGLLMAMAVNAFFAVIF